MKEKIELYKMRTFTEMLSDTFLFVRQNFKPFFKGLFFITSPALLLTVIAGFFFWNGYRSMFHNLEYGQVGTALPMEMFIWMLPMMLSVLVVSTLIMDVTFSYIKLYRQDKDSAIPVSMLWQECKKHFWKLIGAQFTIVMIVVVLMFLFVLLGRLMTGGNVFIMVMFLLFLLFLLSILGMFFGVKLIFYPFFIVVGDSDIIDSFSGSYNFTRGIFWKTFGFLLILGMIVGFASYIFYIPGYIMVVVSAIMGISQHTDNNSFFSLLSSAIMSIGMACAYLLYSVVFIGESIFYFSEIEKEQGIVANREIDEIGRHDD
ncbi:MAG: hypothetical protein FWD66_00775 [Paludibacter sp.]|nr:hypothetical protein [Paludibacter sp.]